MNEQDKLQLQREIECLKNIDHPNILKIYEYFEDKVECKIVTELCEGGELFHSILQKKSFNEKQVATIMKTVISCINYCHQNGIMHRDLKPENIMLEKDQNAFDQIKIIDFGLSRHFK